MGVLSDLNIKPGVICGEDTYKLFEHARTHQYAIPAIVSFTFFFFLSLSQLCNQHKMCNQIILLWNFFTKHTHTQKKECHFF